MQGPQIPPGIFIEEEIRFYYELGLPKGDSLLLCPEACLLGQFHSAAIFQYEEGRVARENKGSRFTYNGNN